MEKEYIIAFSSFYKAAYAQEVLEGGGLRTTLRKLPIEIAKSCSTGLFYKGSRIEEVKGALSARDITVRGIYLIEKEGKEKTHYTLVR